MDTKWKKSKGVLSVLFLLVGLTLTVIFGGLAILYAGYLNPQKVADAFRGDYQNTRQFRSEISYALRAALETQVSSEVSSCLDDPNLCWGIWKNGKVLYGDLSDIQAMGRRGKTGYNFYLLYQNGKVTVWKDEEEVDVYGDGVFRDQWDQWELPGYENLDLFSYLGWIGDSGSGHPIRTTTAAADPVSSTTPVPDETTTDENTA